MFYVFLRNICRIKLYINGWGFILFLMDISLFVNIERICLRRNIYYGYVIVFFILNIDFECIYNDFFLIVKSLELCIGGFKY